MDMGPGQQDPPPLPPPPTEETKLVDDVSTIYGITDDGWVIFDRNHDTFSVWAVPVTGGTAQLLSERGKNISIHGNLVTFFGGANAYAWTSSGGVHATAVATFAQFSDDGSRVAYGADTTGSQPAKGALWVANSNGSGSPRKIGDDFYFGGTSGCATMAAFHGDRLLVTRCGEDSREATLFLVDLTDGSTRELSKSANGGFMAHGDLAVYFELPSVTGTALRLSTGELFPIGDVIYAGAATFVADDALVYFSIPDGTLRRASIGGSLAVVDLTTTSQYSATTMVASPDGKRVAWGTSPEEWGLADSVTARPSPLLIASSSRLAGATAFSEDSRFAFYLASPSSSNLGAGTLTVTDADGAQSRTLAEKCSLVRTAGAHRVVFAANTDSVKERADLFQADLDGSAAPIQLAAGIDWESFAVDQARTRVAYARADAIYVIGLK